MSKNNGGPAFPSRVENHSDEPIHVLGQTVGPRKSINFLGMSVRDYFAAKAMQSMLRDPMAMGCLRKSLENTMQVISRDAYAAADAMLAEREREQ